MIYLIIGNLILLVLSVIWAVNDDSMEPKIVAGTFGLTIIGLFIAKKRQSESISKSVTMTQDAGDNSQQYQSGRDITINK